MGPLIGTGLNLVRVGPSLSRAALLTTALLGAACATPYQPRGLSGGFSETRLDASTFRVTFQGNAYTARDRVEAYLLRRAAEVTLAEGFDYFVLLSVGTDADTAVVTMPGTYTATTTSSAHLIGTSAYGSATTVGTYRPGAVIPFTHYTASALIRAFRGEKPPGLAAFDAREVLGHVGTGGRVETRAGTAPASAAPPPVGAAAAPSAGSVESASPHDRVTLTGSYAGTITGEQNGRPLTMRMSVTVAQQGRDVSGTWAATGGTSGTLAGSLAERDVLTFRVRQLIPCPGEFSGTALIEADGARLVGSYSGKGCHGQVQASFSVLRQ